MKNFAFVGLMALSVGACGDDDGGGGGTPDSGGVIVIDGGGIPDAPSNTDVGDDFASAAPLTVGDTNGITETIGEAGDDDFYVIQATAGDWLAVRTSANPGDDPTMIDTVITMYDSTMTQVAENDDAIPRVNVDSEVIFHVPATGTYYIQLREFSEWIADGSTQEGGPTYFYTVTATVLTAATPGTTIEAATDPGDNAASKIAAVVGNQGFLVLGLFKDTADTDVYELVIPGAMTFNLSTEISNDGNLGFGGTVSAGKVYLTDAAGTTIIARVDAAPAASSRALGPSLAAGTYLLFIERAAGAGGANPFYMARAIPFGDNPAETEVGAAGTNNTAATAQALTVQNNADGSQSYFILAHLVGNTDVDYFSFGVGNAAHKITVACSSLRSGSGVLGMKVELKSGADAPIFQMTETANMNLNIQDQTPTGTGNHLIKLSKTGQDAEVTGDWVRCGVHVGPPTP